MLAINIMPLYKKRGGDPIRLWVHLFSFSFLRVCLFSLVLDSMHFAERKKISGYTLICNSTLSLCVPGRWPQIVASTNLVSVNLHCPLGNSFKRKWGWCLPTVTHTERRMSRLINLLRSMSGETDSSGRVLSSSQICAQWNDTQLQTTCQSLVGQLGELLSPGEDSTEHSRQRSFKNSPLKCRSNHCLANKR